MKVLHLKHEGASAQLIIWGDKGHETSATFASLYSIHRGRGHATAVMNKMTDYADTHSLMVMLDAKQFGPKIRTAMSNEALIDFYGRFGFVVRETTRYGVFMIRQPQPKENT